MRCLCSCWLQAVQQNLVAWPESGFAPTAAGLRSVVGEEELAGLGGCAEHRRVRREDAIVAVRSGLFCVSPDPPSSFGELVIYPPVIYFKRKFIRSSHAPHNNVLPGCVENIEASNGCGIFYVSCVTVPRSNVRVRGPRTTHCVGPPSPRLTISICTLPVSYTHLTLPAKA